MVDFVEENPIDLRNVRKEEESDDLLKQLVHPGSTPDDELNPRVMSFKELIPTISPESVELSEEEILDEETLVLFLDQLDYSDPKDLERFWKAQARFGETKTTEEELICGGPARVAVRGSGSFDDDPFLGKFCCAAIDKFNQVNRRQCKFARALEATADICLYTWYCITFEATTEAGYTETFNAEVKCDTEDEVLQVEVVNIECGDESKSQNDGSPTTKEKDLKISGRGYCYADEGAGAGAGAGAWEGKEVNESEVGCCF